MSNLKFHIIRLFRKLKAFNAEYINMLLVLDTVKTLAESVSGYTLKGFPIVVHQATKFFLLLRDVFERLVTLLLKPLIIEGSVL